MLPDSLLLDIQDWLHGSRWYPDSNRTWTIYALRSGNAAFKHLKKQCKGLQDEVLYSELRPPFDVVDDRPLLLPDGDDGCWSP